MALLPSETPDPAVAPASSRSATCTCFGLRRLARRVSRLYDTRLAPHGLRVTQYSLLSILAAGDSATLTALADRLEMDRTTLTRNLRPLVAQGLIAIEPGDDPRARRARLTGPGRERQRAARPAWRQAQREVGSLLGADGVEGLHRAVDEALSRLRAASQQDRT